MATKLDRSTSHNLILFSAVATILVGNAAVRGCPGNLRGTLPAGGSINRLAIRSSLGLCQQVRNRDTAPKNLGNNEGFYHEASIWESDYGDDCVFSFQTEDDINESLLPLLLKAPETTPASGDPDPQQRQDECALTTKIIHESNVHLKALIADRTCRYDDVEGYWYTASCVESSSNDSSSRGLPSFIFHKAFCAPGCTMCADPEDLPDAHGGGPLYRVRKGEPMVAICELTQPRNLPKNGYRNQHSTTRTYVQYEGNCVKHSCKDDFYYSTMTYIE